MTLFGGAAFWILAGSVLGLLASIKFHSPNFLADRSWLTYGRVHPAGLNALVYGFGVPAGIGVVLWLFARLGRVRLAGPWAVVVAAKLWNLGVLLGVLGILRGASTGFEWLEMPRYASPLLFLAYLVMALSAVTTHLRRQERALYPSHWFLLAALFWFPWIYSTGNLLLMALPVRGVVQALVNWWYANNLLWVWLSLVGLASTFYFLSKLSERPLQSHYTALFGFWTLILFGSWAGVPAGAPLPAWIPALSRVAAVLTAVPVLAVAAIAQRTLSGRSAGGKTNLALRFIIFGVAAFVIAGLMNVAGAAPGVSRVTGFTWFGPAQTQLQVFGFFAMTMFGAIYYLLPRVTGVGFPFAGAVRAHFWCAALGILLLALPLAVGGVVQGWKLNDTTVPFMDVAKSTLPFLRVSTLGDTAIALGNAFFLVNLCGLLLRYACVHSSAAYAAATADLKLAEAAS